MMTLGWKVLFALAITWVFVFELALKLAYELAFELELLLAWIALPT